MSYRPGELDQRVSVYRKVSTSDGMGGSTTEWVLQGAYWAHVRPLSGGESTEHARVQGKAMYLFVFRNGIDLRDADRLDWQGEQHNIRIRKQPSKRRLYLEVEGERGVAQ